MTEFLAIPVPTLSSSRRRCAPLSSHHCSRKSRVPSSRSEEHTSELQSQSNLVCRLLLEKKNKRCDPLILTSLDFFLRCPCAGFAYKAQNFPRPAVSPPNIFPTLSTSHTLPATTPHYCGC